MTLFIMLLNLTISYFNARSCGRVWAESKAIGGWFRLVVWAGAVMAAAGFTSVYVLGIAYIAVSSGFLPQSMIKSLASLSYIVIIIPVLCSGVIITLESWIAFAREKSLMNLGVAGWNTFAQGYNIYNAVNSFGDAWDTVAKGFGILTDDIDDDSDSNNLKVILLVALALLAGIVTTAIIIKKYTATLPVSEAVRDAQFGTRDLSYR